MAWNCIRKATQEDKDALEKAARRFRDRHNMRNLMGEPCSYVRQVEDNLDYLVYDSDPDAKRLERLWLACVKRALNEPSAEGIAWDMVGSHAY